MSDEEHYPVSQGPPSGGIHGIASLGSSINGHKRTFRKSYRGTPISMKDWRPLTSNLDCDVYRTSPQVSPRRIPTTHRSYTTNNATGSLSPRNIPKSSRKPKEGINLVPPPVPPLPEVMCFMAWWNENGVRTNMKVEYYTVTRTFKIQVDIPMAVEVRDRYGRELEEWDLHVGAVLTILGKPVILKKAHGDSLAWLDYQAKKLMKQKDGLEGELSKFCFVSFTDTHHNAPHSPDFVFSHNPHQPAGGKVYLRGVLNEIGYLREELSRYKSLPPLEPDEV